MLNPIRWFKSQKSWWKDRKDSPVHRSELREIEESVHRAVRGATDGSFRPTLQGSLPSREDGTPVLLACCDEGYFYKFGRQLAISSIEADKATRIHLHVYNPSPLCTADAEFLQERLGPKLTVSMEGPKRNPYQGHSAYFYAAGRFAVAAEVMNTCNAPIMVIDVDGVVRSSMAAEFGKLADCDIGLILRLEKRKPWRKILACAVFVNPTENGKEFINRLSAAIHVALLSRPDHHVDQTALHYLLESCSDAKSAIRIAQLGMTWGDHDFADESVIWSAKGGRKHEFNGVSLQQARRVMLGR